MKKILKIIAAVLCLFILIGVVGSCGDDSSSKKDIVGASEAAKENGTDAPGNIDTEESEATETTLSAVTEDITIKEKVLVDKKGIKITALEYVEDSIWGEGIKVLIENSSKKNVTVGLTSMAVNNYMISDLFSADCAAGKKTNETIYLYNSQLRAAGIDNVGKVEFVFHIYDSDSWDNIYTAKKAVVLKTSAYENMDTKPNDKGKTLYKKNGIRIVGKQVDEDTFWGSAVLLYIENNTKKTVTVSAKDMSINGFMVTPYFSCTLLPGKMAIDDISILSSDLEENGIESIEEIELKFHIYNANNYKDIANTKAITIKTK